MRNQHTIALGARRRHAALAALLCLSVAVPAAAGPDRERVELMLSNHERVPDRAELRALGPDVDAVLREIIEQPSHRLLARTRAIALLGEFRSKTNAKLLLQVIKDNAEVRRGLGLIDLQHALIAYAAQRGPKALEVLEPFLSHAKLDVRARAARAVRVAGGPEAKRALKLQLDNEPSATVRVEIQRQLELLEKPQRAGSR